MFNDETTKIPKTPQASLQAGATAVQQESNIGFRMPGHGAPVCGDPATPCIPCQLVLVAEHFEQVGRDTQLKRVMREIDKYFASPTVEGAEISTGNEDIPANQPWSRTTT